MRRIKVLLLMGVAVALIAAACGGSDSTKEDFINELVAQDLFTQSQAECFVDRIWDDIGPLDVDKLASADGLSESELEVLTTATVSCLGLDSNSEPGFSGQPGFSSDFSPGDAPPGDDATLDALWVACGGGDAAACDELFFTSDSGSDYEEFGLTCGGRGNGDCVQVIGSE